MFNILENLVQDVINYLENSGLGLGFKNNPARTKSGGYRKNQGEKFDFCIFTHDCHFFFDCKQTTSNIIRLRDKELRQINNLTCLNILDESFDCFFLGYFINYETFVKYPLGNMVGKKQLKINDGFIIPKLSELFII